jgi:hypothetical protein
MPMSLITTLSDVTSGLYLIRTRSGSQQVINLDRMTICRIAPAETNRPLRQDDTEIDILFMGKCELGRELIRIVDLHLPGIIATFRRTTEVLAIESLEFEPPYEGKHQG